MFNKEHNLEDSPEIKEFDKKLEEQRDKLINEIGNDEYKKRIISRF